MRVIVIGGGIAGMSAALAMHAKGFAVTLIERDPPPPADFDPHASSPWRRRGAPQVPHPHFLMGGLRNLIYAHHPRLVDALLAAGVWELQFADSLHPVAKATYRPIASDAQLTAFVSRRATLEIVIRKYVDSLQGVEVLADREVERLLFERTDPLTVVGVAVRDRTGASPPLELRGDVVIDASGRSGRLHRQLIDAGATVLDEHYESGDVYFTRVYRLNPGQHYAPLHGLPGIITDGFTIGMLPADNGYFTVTIAVWKADSALYEAVKEPSKFDAFCRLIPRAAGWIDPAFATPVNDVVYGFGGLDSFWRKTVVDGRPNVLGLFFIGDTALRTNPKYGRGCTWGFTQAHLLADILVRESDPTRRIAAYEETLEREFRGNWRATLDMDRARRRRHEANLAARPLSIADRIALSLDNVVIQRGMRADANLHRAIMTGYHGLAGLSDWAKSPSVWWHALKIACTPATRHLPDPIPPRERIVAALGAA
ncbi:MAG TPA: FAD-dependent oxidoreductase [Pseudomonadales bacterium]|nr:FAD-dependent oxidoreductase [Pseudomonadales bacterium]